MSTQDTFMKVVTAGVIIGLVGIAYWQFVNWFCNAMKGQDPLPPAAKKTTKKTSKKTVKKMKSKKVR